MLLSPLHHQRDRNQTSAKPYGCFAGQDRFDPLEVLAADPPFRWSLAGEPAVHQVDQVAAELALVVVAAKYLVVVDDVDGQLPLAGMISRTIEVAELNAELELQDVSGNFTRFMGWLTKVRP
jgi:hypothetical protein